MRFILIFILLPLFFKAQDYTKLKIKKQFEFFHFFQLGIPHDSIADNENDLFFMKISNAKRCNTKVEVMNGQLQSQSDSIFKLVFLRNMNYLHIFVDSIPNGKPKNQKKSNGKYHNDNCTQFKTLVNGAGSNSNSNVITVKFKNASNDSVYLTNKFHYK